MPSQLAVAAPLPSLARRRLQSYLALVVSDTAAAVSGIALGGWLYTGRDGLERSLLFAQLALPLFLTIGLYNGAYSVRTLGSLRHGIFRVVSALAIGMAAVQFVAFYARANQTFSRLGLAVGFALAVVLLVSSRAAMRRFVRWRCGSTVQDEVLIDDGGPVVAADGLRRICASQLALVPALDDPHALDRIGLAIRNADRVFVTCPPERRACWALVLKGANVRGTVIDETVATLGARGALVSGGQGWLEVSSGPLGMRARAAKRGFDIAVAGLALVLLWPVMVMVAVAIRLEDGGPVLFVQRRVGRGNRFINVWKFRSMRYGRADADGRQSTTRDDVRVTRVGRLIRAVSIDELPQLFNVLAGDMSLVGPRPHALGSQAGDKLFWEVDQRYWQRHALKPGITGLAQVRGLRGATEQEGDLQQRLEADLEYLHGWSLWRDARILVATLRVVMHDKAF